MELRQLRYFCMVAEELNFTRAAARLHMAQPPLSRQIKTLEQEVGAPLFERQTRGLELTKVGEYFLNNTRQSLERMDATLAATRKLARRGCQAFGIGLAGSMLYGKLPRLISELKEKDDVELLLLEMNTIDQLHALKTGRIDIGFGRLRLDDPEIEQQVLVQEPLVAMLPKGHPLEGCQPSLEDIAHFPLITYPAAPRPSLADMVLGYFRRRGLKVTVVQEVNEMQTAMGLVAANLGISLVPAPVMGLQREEICYASLKDTSITAPVICSRRKEPATQAMNHTNEVLARMLSNDEF